MRVARARSRLVKLILPIASISGRASKLLMSMCSTSVESSSALRLLVIGASFIGTSSSRGNGPPLMRVPRKGGAIEGGGPAVNMRRDRPMTEPMPMRAPTREGVLRAADKVAALLPPTPLLPFEIAGATVWAKAECLQPIGAFKIRGAWHRLSDLSDEERARGVVGVSSGNHAQGVAWAARKLGIAATIVMPRDAPVVKLERTRALGADVVLYDRAKEDRDAVAAKVLAERGGTLVHAFADRWVIEGQGSTGIEIASQMERWAVGPPTR